MSFQEEGVHMSQIQSKSNKLWNVSKKGGNKTFWILKTLNIIITEILLCIIAHDNIP